MTALPPAVARHVAGYVWHRISIGQSRASVHRLEQADQPSLILKILPRDKFVTLDGEAARLRWLRRHLPVPDVVDYTTAHDVDFLLLTALPGRDATTSDLAPAELVDLLADALRLFHSTPLDGCPFRLSIGECLANAKAILDAGRVAEDKFDADNLGRAPADLFAELLSLQPADEASVVVHGDYCLPNVIVDRNQLGGFIDFGRAGASDPHFDLALGARSITSNLGPGWDNRFFTRYGLRDPDPKRLRFFRLLDEFV